MSPLEHEEVTSNVIHQTPFTGSKPAWSMSPEDHHLDPAPRSGQDVPDPDDPVSHHGSRPQPSREPEPWQDHHLDPPSPSGDRFEPWE